MPRRVDPEQGNSRDLWGNKLIEEAKQTGDHVEQGYYSLSKCTSHPFVSRLSTWTSPSHPGFGHGSNLDPVPSDLPRGTQHAGTRGWNEEGPQPQAATPGPKPVIKGTFARPSPNFASCPTGLFSECYWGCFRFSISFLELVGPILLRLVLSF